MNFTFFKFLNAKDNDRKLCSSKAELIVQNCLNHNLETKCEKQSDYLNYFKFNIFGQLINENSSSLSKYNNLNKFYQNLTKFKVKIMTILISILIITFIISDSLNSSLAKSGNFNHSSSHKSHMNDNFIAEKYSVNKNSSLFYDLSLYDNDLTDHLTKNKIPDDKKSIYFQFIKPSTPNYQIKKQSNHQTYLQRFMLNSTFCNDGTRSGYYFRKGKTKNWIIFLEGGWFCYSLFTCNQRWLQMRNFMTSAHWPEKKLINGILSSKSEENPYYFNANHVYVPYCSSDGWSGDSPANSSKDLHFSGSKIIQNVIKDLVSKGLNEADLVYLAGSSAGGTGVLINLDQISDLITSINPKISTRGLVDSGWFLDNEPFKNLNLNNLLAKKLDNICLAGQLCSPIESVKQGFKLWNSRLPASCQDEYPNEQWRCFFGHRIHRTLRTPVFVVQWLFDEAQLTANNVAMPTTKAHWRYVFKMGLQMRNSLRNVSGLFAPSCISHTLLTKRNWNQIKINGYSLSEAIKCWESKQIKAPKSQLDSTASDVLNLSAAHLRKNNNRLKNDVDLIDPINSIYSSNYPNVFNFKQSNLMFNELFQSSKRKKVKHRNKKLRNYDLNLKETISNRRCSVRLIDECTYPQCNQQCPKLRNLFTGEEIHFFDLLKQFGLK